MASPVNVSEGDYFLMNNHARRVIQNTAFISTAALLLTVTAFGTPPQASKGAANSSQTASHNDRWLHVRVTNPDSKEETVRVNVPLELAEKVLPTIDRDRLHN